jgi:hypothetical protein
MIFLYDGKLLPLVPINNSRGFHQMINRCITQIYSQWAVTIVLYLPLPMVEVHMSIHWDPRQTGDNSVFVVSNWTQEL